MNELLSFFDGVSVLQMVLLGALVVFVWFLPVLLAAVFNPKQMKLIAIACVPAGFSLIAWGAVMVWALTGRAVEKYLPKKIRERLATEAA